MKKYLLTLVALLCLGFTMNAQVNLQDGLVGYWPFNGNANDESGNGNHGTVNGATLTADRFGNTNKAYSFNGISDNIFVSNSSLVNNNALSISLWFYPQSFQSNGVLVATGNQNDYAINYKNDSLFIVIHTDIDNLGNGGAYFDTIPDVISNKWKNIILKYDGNKSDIYLDGVLKSSTIVNGNIYSWQNDGLAFGTYTVDGMPTTEFFSGKIDDIHIYNRALNEQEIQALYTEGQTVDLNSGLVAYYPFNGNANDASGNGLHGTVFGDVVLTTDRFGNENCAYDFPGTAFNYIQVADDISLHLSEFTISAWIYSETDYGYGQIVQKNRDITSGHYGLYTSSVGATVSYGVGVGTSPVPEPSIGSWHMITGSVSGNVAKFFIDGQLVADTVASSSFTYTGSEPLAIGMHYYSGVPDYWTYPFKGKIDDIFIYNRALNEQEIQALYNGGSEFTVSSETAFAQIDTSIEIPVLTTSLNVDDAIYSYQFVYSFDETILEYNGYSIGSTISENGTVLVNANNPGQLIVSYMRETPLVGEGELINFNFNAISGGTSPLTITNFKYNETDVTSITNGTITVVSPTTAEVTYSTEVITAGTELLITATFSNAINENLVPQIALSGANTLTATDMVRVSETVYTYLHTVEEGAGLVYVTLSSGVDVYGFDIISTPAIGESFEIITFTYGDVTGNGEITAYDAALTLMYSVGIDPMPADAPLPWAHWRIISADVDGVEGITANDASLILQYSAGLIMSFPVENETKSEANSNADIVVTAENGEIILVTSGELFGLNVFVHENFEVLGEPQLLIENVLFVKNITDANYAIGLATAYAPVDNTAIIKIPYSTSQNLDVTFDMIINSTPKSVTVGLTTGIVTVDENVVMLYPNPTNSILYLSGVNKANISIFDVSGRMVIESQNIENQINVSQLSKGIYSIRIDSKQGTITRKFVKN